MNKIEYFEKPTEVTSTGKVEAKKNEKEISDTLREEMKKNLEKLGKSQASSKVTGYVTKQD